MRFGLNVLNFGPGAAPERLLQWARFAEETGYHLVMISDHVAITPDVQQQFPAPFYDPFIALAWIAAATKTVEIGTTVAILPYRHPLLTSRMAANIDQLSGGRFILGIGVGWAKQEYAALGVPFERRGELASEYIEAIKACWAKDVVNYYGRYVSFENVQTGPAPAQPEGPPVWVGGSSEAALRRAVRYGDCWHPYRFTLEWLGARALPRLRQLAEEEQRRAPLLCPRLSLRLTERPLPEGRRAAGQGSIDQIRSDLESLAELEAEYVLLDTYTGLPEQTLHPEKDWAFLARLADEVLDLDKETFR